MNSGYLGSFVIHGVLIAIGLSAASLAVPDSHDEPPGTGGTTITFVPGDPPGGNDGTPGGGPVAAPKTPVKWTPVKVIDSKQLLAQWQANQVVPAPPTKPTAPVRPTPDGDVSTSPTRPVKPRPRTSPHASPPGGPSEDGPPMLVAPTVGPGTGVPGPGSDRRGLRGGQNVSGPGGGVGTGDSSALAASVRSEFAGVYIPLFREQGADIAGDRDSGEVKLRVSPAGNVTFAEWVTRPSEPLLEKIVRRSIESMRPVPPPKDGAEALVSIKFSGSVE